MFAFQDRCSAVEVAFTDRFGGVSTGPYAELNLSVPRPAPHRGHPGSADEAAAVATNRRRVLAALAAGTGPGDDAAEDPLQVVTDVAALRQVHGADVVRVGAAPPDGDPTGPAEPEGDALVTAVPGRVLLVRAADCVPVLLADPDRRLVGAAHAGRRGVQAGVVTSTVAALHDLGAERLVAWIGPAACGRCYEVPAAMREEVATVVPETWSETSWGTPALDLVAGVRAQLRTAGVGEAAVVERCTLEDAAFFSHRRQAGVAGRQGGLIWVRP